jgi:cellulase/cellobiase CelA1
VTNDELRTNIEAARREAKSWAFRYLAGTKVVNEQTQWSVLISKSGLKHTLGLYRTNKEFELEALRSIQLLPELLQSALFVATEPDTTNNNITNVYRFRAVYGKDASIYTVGIVLKEQRLQDVTKIFYDHHIINRT